MGGKKGSEKCRQLLNFFLNAKIPLAVYFPKKSNANKTDVSSIAITNERIGQMPNVKNTNGQGSYNRQDAAVLARWEQYLSTAGTKEEQMPAIWLGPLNHLGMRGMCRAGLADIWGFTDR